MLPIDFKKIQRDDYIVLIAKGEVGSRYCESSEVFMFKENTYGDYMALTHKIIGVFTNVRHMFSDGKPRFRYPYRNEVKLCTK